MVDHHSLISSMITNIIVICFQSRQKYFRRLDKQVQFTGFYINTKKSEVKLVFFLSVIISDALFLVTFFAHRKIKKTIFMKLQDFIRIYNFLSVSTGFSSILFLCINKIKDTYMGWAQFSGFSILYPDFSFLSSSWLLNSG